MKIKWNSNTLRVLWHKGFYQWIKHYRILFFVAFLILSGVSFYEWYRDLGHYEWTEQQKKEYLDRTIKETSFQQEKFEYALSKLEEQKQAHGLPSLSSFVS